MIEIALHGLLNDQSLYEYFGGRVFSCVAESSDSIYAVTTVVSDSRPLNVDLTAQQIESAIQLDIYGKNVDELGGCARAVIDILHGKRFALEGLSIQLVLLRSGPRSSYEHDTRLYRKMMEFVFHYSFEDN